MKPQQAQAGLTLVELLVAMALIGIVFAMITNWQVSTLNISMRTNATSQRLSDLNDVTGYVGDRVRSGIYLRTTGFTVNSASAYSSGACNTTTPCLAVLVPETDPNIGKVTAAKVTSGTTTLINEISSTGVRYRYHLYRLEPRSSLSADDKPGDSWADNNTQVLIEYRGRGPATGVLASVCPSEEEKLTPTDCTDVMTKFVSETAFKGLIPYLVADYLTPADELGSGVAPFAYDATTKSVTLAFQTKQQVRGQTQLTPATPYTLTVQARNVP